MYRKIIIILALFVILSGCAGLGDWSYDLPGGYQIERINAEQIVLSEKETEFSAKIIVESFVSKIAFSDEFIYIQQVENREYAENPNADASYYIISVSDGWVSGPMDKNQFEGKFDNDVLNSLKWMSTVNGNLSE